MEFKSAVLGLLVVVWLFGSHLIQGRSVCEKDKYWSEITGNCDPCSALCDPPAVYETDCPKYCPNYKPRPPATTSSPKSGYPSTTLLIIVSVISGLVLLVLSVCLAKKICEKIQKIITTYIQVEKRMDHANYSIEEQAHMNPTDEHFRSISTVDRNTTTLDRYTTTVDTALTLDTASTVDTALTVDTAYNADTSLTADTA